MLMCSRELRIHVVQMVGVAYEQRPAISVQRLNHFCDAPSGSNDPAVIYMNF